MIVVKVGGSLYDLPVLQERLNRFLERYSDEICLIPGGGAAANLVREWDRTHHPGEDAAHWLASQAMDLAGSMLTRFITTNPMVSVLRIESWLRDHDELPHSWDVTSDSIAAFVAFKMNASQLILLKSIDVPAGISWDTAAAMGWVDAYFPKIAQQLTCPVKFINLKNHFAR